VPRETIETQIAGKKLTLSNLEKVLYPAAHFTKARVIDYYTRVAAAIIPHLKDRPLTLKRYPNGVDGEFFYEKNCPLFRPSWIRTAHREKETSVDYCVINDLPSLVWVANLAAIELHTLLSLGGRSQRPTMIVFDLDPGPSRDVMHCAEIALRLRDFFKGMGLESFAKTSGGKGIHMAIPLNSAVIYDQTKEFAHRIALTMEQKFPDEITSQMNKTLRPGKIFIDWSQNSEHKTTVCPYSLRAQKKPSVSTPVTWKELETACAKKDPKRLTFSPEDVIQRIQRSGDPYAPVLTLKQKLPKI
jgi:bifunctional non-homologous end joining protein LigD